MTTTRCAKIFTFQQISTGHTRTVTVPLWYSSNIFSQSLSIIPSWTKPMPEEVTCWSVGSRRLPEISDTSSASESLPRKVSPSMLWRYVMRSMAVSCACLLLGTKMIDGLPSECLITALYTGLPIAISLPAKLLWSNEWKYISRGIGRTLDEKLKSPLGDTPIQSPTSRALAREALRPIMRSCWASSFCCFWVLMKRIREIITSMVGPTSPPKKCTSSTINRVTDWTAFRCLQRRLIPSHCFAVQEIIFASASNLRSSVISPVSCTTWPDLKIDPNRLFQSRNIFRDVSSFGATYTHLPLGSLTSIRIMANSAQADFPDPEGAQIRQFLSVLNKWWNVWVWIGLNSANLNSLMNAFSPRTETGNGCKSKSSVGG